MGENIEQQKIVLAQTSEDAMVVDTTGARMHVRWGDGCPLLYSRLNASRPMASCAPRGSGQYGRHAPFGFPPK